METTMPKFDLEECAEWMCEEDANMAECMSETAAEAAKYPGWRGSSEIRREAFLAKARLAVADGKYVIGSGWMDPEQDYRLL